MVTALLERPALHPAARRRQAAAMPPEPLHAIVLRPLGNGDARSMIVTAKEHSFIAAIFADLQAPDWEKRLAARHASERRGDGAVLELGLPTHRHFQVVLLEAVCRMPGSPRVDPARLVSLGLVLRRIEKDGRLSGWMKAGDQPVGWLNVAPNLSPGDDPDPDPARRLPDDGTVSGQLATLLASRRGGTRPTAEEIVPLFTAPPEVCDALGKTVVYGIVPVASSDTAGTAELPDFNDLGADDAAAVAAHLTEYLRYRPKLPMPQAGKPLDRKWGVLQTPSPTTSLAADVVADWPRLNAFGIFLQQLQLELGAFGKTNAAKALLAELSKLSLPMARDGNGTVTWAMPADIFVAKAAAILIAGDDNLDGLTMPLEWPLIDDVLGPRLTRAAQACLTAQFRNLIAETPKFDRDDRLYMVRPFVRVAGHDHCPPKLVWCNGYSEPFRILPWWDSDAPAARISLPALSKLRHLKPNITFELPPTLAGLLQGDMKKLKDGEGNQGPEFGLGWLCSFSIPIITICAFIVLNIFLSLFDIIFWWMAYLKICIPYPKPK